RHANRDHGRVRAAAARRARRQSVRRAPRTGRISQRRALLSIRRRAASRRPAQRRTRGRLGARRSGVSARAWYSRRRSFQSGADDRGRIHRPDGSSRRRGRDRAGRCVTDAIRAKELTRTFGDFTAVDHITFDVKAGEVFGFLGANGAGKTTAMRMMIGLLSPSGGTARVAGLDVYTQAESIKRSIGYMSQRFSLYEDLTPRENIRLYGGIYGLTLAQIRERTDRMLTRLGMMDQADDAVRALPLGWRQKLAFSVALVH